MVMRRKLSDGIRDIFIYLHAHRWKEHGALCRNLHFIGNVGKIVGICEERHPGILFLSCLGEGQAERRDKGTPFVPGQTALCLVSLHYSYVFPVWPFFFRAVLNLIT